MTLALTIATLLGLALTVAFAAARSTYIIGRPVWVDALCAAAMIVDLLAAAGCILFAAFHSPDATALKFFFTGALAATWVAYCWVNA